MSNCLTVIVRAMRRIGVIGSGQLPTTDEQTDALETLKGIYHRFCLDGAFGPLIDVMAPETDFEALPGQRVYFAQPNMDLISLPDLAPDNSRIVVINKQVNQTYDFVYDAGSRTWIDLNALDLTSEAPFSQRDIIGLSCVLAVELAAEYGQESALGKTTVDAAMRFHAGLVFNWSEIAPRTQDWTNYF